MSADIPPKKVSAKTWCDYANLQENSSLYWFQPHITGKDDKNICSVFYFLCGKKHTHKKNKQII